MWQFRAEQMNPAENATGPTVGNEEDEIPELPTPDGSNKKRGRKPRASAPAAPVTAHAV